MATKNFEIGSLAYQGAPFIWGSLQDVSGMTVVSQAGPFLVVQDLPGMNIVNDTRSRLSSINLSNGQGLAYNMDDNGNRTSTVVS